ncbi:MAG: hypothetical protein AB1610_03650 [Nitrospirota bacterium]
MLEINWSFIVLAINFFILLFILNIILFRPLLKIFKEREDTVKDSLEAVKEMNAKKEENISNLNRERAEARSKSKELFESLKGEGLQKQNEVLSAARAEATAMIEKAMSEIRSEAEKAKKALRADVEKFSDEIVRKLVGV